MIIIWGCNFENGYDSSTLQMSSFYIIFCWQTKHILPVSVCSRSTTGISGYRLFQNVGISPAQHRHFDCYSWGHYRGPLSAIWQTDWSTILWFSGNPFWELLEDMTLSVRQRLLFQQDGAPAH
jgi:hypothetical protein